MNLFLCVLIAAFAVDVSFAQEAPEGECVVTQFYQVPVALEICDIIILDNLFVPAGQTLELYLRPRTHLYFRGTTRFGPAEWSGPLIEITGTNVVIEGENDAALNAEGQWYWDGLGKWSTKLKPSLFKLQLHNSVVENLNILNPPLDTFSFHDSTHVTITGCVVDASAGDPGNVAQNVSGYNTDGFTFWNSTDISLKNSVIYSQGDCVSIRSGANILVDDVICSGSGGLGISAGSSSEFELNTVQNVTFKNSVANVGSNGIHIRTYVDGGYGVVENVTFASIKIAASANYGIIIQENYKELPPDGILPSSSKNNVPITNLTLSDISGRVADTAVPIYILCADDGCFDWTFNNITVNGTKNSVCNYGPLGFSC